MLCKRSYPPSILQNSVENNMGYFIKRFEEQIVECWNSPALGDYRAKPLTYGELAGEIEMLHIVFRTSGLAVGDKIAINAASSTNWGTTFMAITSAGYVATVLFNGFLPADTQRMVNHSDSRLLFTERTAFEKMDFEAMPQLIGVVDIKSGALLASRGDFGDIYQNRRKLFVREHPMGISPEEICYTERSEDSLCCILYTSGSTGNPKGVMLSVGSIDNNVDLFITTQPYYRGDRYLSLLPFSHIFGMLADLVTGLCVGMHITVLGMPPVPKVLKQALCTVRPRMIMMVPLVLMKMIDYTIGEFINSQTGKQRLDAYRENEDFCTALRTILTEAMGGRVELVLTGGAAIPAHIERLMIKKLKVPYITGYGMTECGPLISIGHSHNYILKSTGIIVDGMEAKIDSIDPAHIAGELLVRGKNLFMGYYKNEEANAEAFTDDGWFHTGDLGTLDSENNLFLVGRCKSMLLSTNGQNVFPEEIEVILNTLPYVAESLIVQRDNHLAAIIVPDVDALERHNIDHHNLVAMMNENMKRLNESIPAYEAVSTYQLHFEPFAKTPKGSIKRFLYK